MKVCIIVQQPLLLVKSSPTADQLFIDAIELVPGSSILSSSSYCSHGDIKVLFIVALTYDKIRCVGSECLLNLIERVLIAKLCTKSQT